MTFILFLISVFVIETCTVVDVDCKTINICNCQGAIHFTESSWIKWKEKKTYTSWVLLLKRVCDISRAPCCENITNVLTARLFLFTKQNRFNFIPVHDFPIHRFVGPPYSYLVRGRSQYAPRFRNDRTTRGRKNDYLHLAEGHF